MIKFNYKGKKVCINHLDLFIKPFKNDFQLRKVYFEEIKNKLIEFKKLYSSDMNYYLVMSKRDYRRCKYSLLYDIYLPVQSIILKKVLELPEGKYIVGTPFNNYEFIRNKEFAFSGLPSKEEATFFIDNDELISIAKRSLQEKKNVFNRI